ncbi:uncharacterized protein [Centruroides vittatus]|uniref:uncharacterized protein n=2 Tax=Centruroides vittatus TaxID=120091 RepID=UPI0035109ED6
MKRSTYNEALMDYIGKTECEKINSNFIGSLDRKVRKLEVSKLSNALPFLRKCRNPRPGTPRLFAFAKVHKTGKEIRPVVEKCRGPTFVLEKRLHEYLSSQLDTDTLVAHDPMKVVKDLQNIALMEDEVATVFDYESMYPSVKIESCEEALLDFLYCNNSELLNYTEEVKNLASLVCRESCFTFNGQVYRQRRGVPMGSPLSGILCELVVRRLERRVFHAFKEDIMYFSRYVDDLFILWRNNSRIKDFLDKINDNNDGLTLRLEQKSSLNLHFLDIDITFKKGHLSTNVFIKPSHSPLYIPSQSKDPYKYKIAAFRALIRRAFLYCERVQDRRKEINRIINVAKALGYQKSAILGIVKKYEANIKKKFFKNAPNRSVKFTYSESMNAVMKEIAHRKGSRMLLKRAPNLYKILRNDKDDIKSEEKAGVYKIPYENMQLDVKKDYIGVTTRSLGLRIKEHSYNIRKGSNATILSQMAQAPGAIVKWNEATIINPLSSPSLALTAEKLQIYRSRLQEGCLNARDAESLPSAWKFMIYRC